MPQEAKKETRGERGCFKRERAYESGERID
jgi:hypothetical protein